MLTAQQEELLESDIALDVEVIGSPTIIVGVWQLYGFLDGKEYLWGSTGCFAGSIGTRYENGELAYYAAIDDRFKKAIPGWTCIWYR